MCEGCGLKQAAYGLPADGRRRWCAGCAAAHGGAVSLKQRKMCEGCGLKQPTYGLPADGRRRWCAGCAAAHGEAVRGRSKKRRKKGQEVETSAGKQMLQGQLVREQARLGVIKEALAEQEKKIAETIAMIEDESVRPRVSSFSLIYC